jgi:thiol-disulfide isomerase/thioredoxin
VVALSLLPLACHRGGRPVEAKPATLHVGDPAPKLSVSKWVQGEPIPELRKGTVYLLEFWATWCKPCREEMPHIVAIAHDYRDKGLVVIGANVWEKDEAKIPEFLKSSGVDFPVPMDRERNGQGEMVRDWIEASGSQGIPTSFLVDRAGRIAWFGHPAGLKNEIVEAVLAGSWDPKKAEAASEGFARFRELVANRKGGAALMLAKQLSEAHPDDAGLNNDLAWALVTGELGRSPDLPLADSIARRAVAASKEKDPAVLDTFARVLFLAGKKEEAIATEEKAVSLAPPGLRRDLEKFLASYRAGKLPAV